MLRSLTAVIEREGDGYVAICPKFDIASLGDSVEEARSNLTEAVTLFFCDPVLEAADPAEIGRRSQREALYHAARFRLGKLRTLSGVETCRILRAACPFHDY